MRIAAFEKRIEEQLFTEENEIAAEMRKTRRTFIGMGAVFKQSYTARPQSTEERRGMNPRFFSLEKKAANQCNTSLRIFYFTVQGCVEAVERREKGCHASGGHLCNAYSFGCFGVVSINEVELKRSWAYKKEFDGNAHVFCTPASSVENGGVCSSLHVLMGSVFHTEYSK